MIVVIKRNISEWTKQQQHAEQQSKFCVFRKGMILPKQEDGFFPEREDLPLLEVTAKMGLWYRLIEKAITSEITTS